MPSYAYTCQLPLMNVPAPSQPHMPEPDDTVHNTNVHATWQSFKTLHARIRHLYRQCIGGSHIQARRRKHHALISWFRIFSWWATIDGRGDVQTHTLKHTYAAQLCRWSNATSSRRCARVCGRCGQWDSRVRTAVQHLSLSLSLSLSVAAEFNHRDRPRCCWLAQLVWQIRGGGGFGFVRVRERTSRLARRAYARGYNCIVSLLFFSWLHSCPSVIQSPEFFCHP